MSAVRYLDTSAAAKLVRPEQETTALRKWLVGRRWILSDLHRAELRRAAARTGQRATVRANGLLAEADILRLSVEIFDEAGTTTPENLRSLDALRLAAAGALGSDLAGVVAYDRRLLDAAREAGIRAESPGA
ncbi:MAG: PIN domain-containing protein [Acidimicrobiales bacterium]